MKKIALLFDGQGTQFVGMCKQVSKDKKIVEDIFNKADEILGYSLKNLCYNGPLQKLNDTRYAQPAIFTTSYALYLAFRKEHNICPVVAAGHSLGEYTALTAAGVLDFENALLLVNERGRLMAEAASINKGGMFAVIGIDIDKLNQIVDETKNVYIANHNSKRQIVIAGDKDTILDISNTIEAQSGTLIPLNVSGAFHCPYMDYSAERFGDVLNKFTFNQGNFPVISNVEASEYKSVMEIKLGLQRQITESVRWFESVIQMKNYDPELFVEFGTKPVLKKLMPDIDEKISDVCIDYITEECKIKMSLLDSEERDVLLNEVKRCYRTIMSTPLHFSLSKDEYNKKIAIPANYVKEEYYSFLDNRVKIDSKQVRKIISITNEILRNKGIG